MYCKVNESFFLFFTHTRHWTPENKKGSQNIFGGKLSGFHFIGMFGNCLYINTSCVFSVI